MTNKPAPSGASLHNGLRSFIGGAHHFIFPHLHQVSYSDKNGAQLSANENELFAAIQWVGWLPMGQSGRNKVANWAAIVAQESCLSLITSFGVVKVGPGKPPTRCKSNEILDTVESCWPAGWLLPMETSHLA